MHNSSLVIGCDGLIGRSISEYLEGIGHRVVKTSRTAREGTYMLDLENEPALINLPPGCYDTAYFCAAVTGINKCEENPLISHAVNVIGTLEVIDQLLKRNVFVLFLSSDAVELPNSRYSMQKLEVEHALEGHPVAVVRLGKILSGNSGLLFDWVQMLRRGNAVTPFSNYFFAPIAIEHAVQCIVEFADRRNRGTFTISGLPLISYYEAISYIARKLHLNTALITPVETSTECNLSPVENPSAAFDSWAELDWFCENLIPPFDA